MLKGRVSSAPPAVPAPVSNSVPASEVAVATEKPTKSKAELKAERRARQDAERATKQTKKGEPGQQGATGKPKAPPSELLPGSCNIKSYLQEGKCKCMLDKRE